MIGGKAPCGISCVSCGSRNLRVAETRERDNSVYRRRKCKDCGVSFATVEEPYEISGRGRKLVTKAEAQRQRMQEAAQGFIAAFNALAAISAEFEEIA